MRQKGLDMNTTKTTLYFEKPGKQNTNTLLEHVQKYAKKEHIRDIVIASTTGSTGAKAIQIFKNCNVVIITHAYGSKEPGTNELQETYRNKILKNGGKIFSGTHALSSAERAIRKNFGTIQPLELIANVLRRLGDGTKVCVEITLMAADAGLIPTDKDIIAIGGTSQGADTALRIHPANAARFFELKIREIIAKPQDF
jgi:hypothetical protein